MSLMTACNVKGVPRSDDPTENYHPSQQFSSDVQNFLASLNSLFWLYISQLDSFALLSSGSRFQQKKLW